MAIPRLTLPRRVELTGIELISHLLMSGLDKSGVAKDLLNLGLGGIALDILFLEYIRQRCPLSNTVADVLKDLVLSLVVVRAAEEFVPDR